MIPVAKKKRAAAERSTLPTKFEISKSLTPFVVPLCFGRRTCAIFGTAGQSAVLLGAWGSSVLSPNSAAAAEGSLNHGFEQPLLKFSSSQDPLGTV